MRANARIADVKTERIQALDSRIRAKLEPAKPLNGEETPIAGRFCQPL